ncbi:MAG: tRNA (adenosine(37)-N6)-dimethylallyltransferase MiaA [Chloroflexi bacterium]|nr:tRNA (adenosine(37)-N6)-dimethylallyltransferase MiaA [Chloroflexota bacterium]
MNDILSRGKLPFLVGGSGLYIKAVIGGYRIPQVPPDFKLRVQLEENARSNGNAILVEQLQRIDPVAAQRIDPRNIRRLIRAIEVYYVTGKPFSELTQTTPPPFKVFNIGLTTERQELYKRIDLRVDGMIKKGLIEEVKSLVERGYSYSLPSMQCLGYKQIGAYLREEMTLDEAINQIKIKTRNFARRQYSWYKLEDSVKWFDINNNFKELIESIIKEYIHV